MPRTASRSRQVARRIVGRAETRSWHRRQRSTPRRYQAEVRVPQRDFDDDALDPCGDLVITERRRDLVDPGRQNTRTSRSIASSLPRPTRRATPARRNPQPGDQRLRLRLGVAVESGLARVTGRARIVGMQPLEARVPGGVLIRLQLADIRSRELEDVFMAACLRRVPRAAPRRHWRAHRATRDAPVSGPPARASADRGPRLPAP